MSKNLKLITLNCQKGYQKGLIEFLGMTLISNKYDFILLQEITPELLGKLEKRYSNYGNYNVLKVFNTSVNKYSNLCVFFRKHYRLINSTLFPFTIFSQKNNHRPEYGFLVGEFVLNNTKINIGNIHANSGFNYLIRNKEFKFINECLNTFDTKIPFYFGGDFNTGIIGENARLAKRFAPYFVNVTKNCKATCDSSFVEPVSNLNRFSLILAKFNIHFQFKVDHIFCSRNILSISQPHIYLLPVRVSDHRPIEVVFSKSIVK